MEICDDCFSPFPTHETPFFPYCVNTKEFSSYGIGLYLYFFYLKYIMWVLLVLFGMVAVPQIYHSRNYQKVVQNYCARNLTITETLCGNFTNRDLDWLWAMNSENFGKNFYIKARVL